MIKEIEATYMSVYVGRLIVEGKILILISCPSANPDRADPFAYYVYGMSSTNGRDVLYAIRMLSAKPTVKAEQVLQQRRVSS